MRTREYFEIINIISFSRLNGNILSSGQCMMLHQYNNGIGNQLNIDLQHKMAFIKDQMHHQKWERPDLMYDGDKTLLIRESNNINYKPFKNPLK